MGENSDNFLSCNSHWSNWDSLYTLSEDDEGRVVNDIYLELNKTQQCICNT